MSTKPKMGLVALASEFELGGERSDELLEATARALTAAGVDLVVGKHVVGDARTALEVCDQFKDSGITSLAVLDVTWQGDHIKYLFTQELNLPTVYWSVSHADTYAIACVQHYGSVLRAQGIPFQYVYGLPDNDALVQKVVRVAKAGKVIEELKNTRIALVGPRNAWRIAGAQEMVNEEWEMSRYFGITIVHVEMDEITDVAKELSDDDARAALKALAPRTGTVTATDDTMLWAAKVYLATKDLVEKYNLDVVAAECYPRYAGLVNAAASWLGDEGLIVETEGDIAGSVAMHILNTAAQGDDVAVTSVLGEVGNYDDDNNHFNFAHEGSSATAYATSVDQVEIKQMEEDGTQVAFIVRPIEDVTVLSLVGAAGKYKMLVAKGTVLEGNEQEWDSTGHRLYAKLRFGDRASATMDTMIREGIDHHWVFKEGDYTDLVQIVCDYLKVDTLRF